MTFSLGPENDSSMAGPDIGAPMAANLTGEFRLQVGQVNVTAPVAGVDPDDVGAFPPHGCRIFRVVNLMLTRVACWEGE